MPKVTLTHVNGASPPASPALTPGGPALGTPGAPASLVSPPPFAGMDTTRVYPALGSVDSVRQEIDDAFEDAKTFYLKDPDEVMRMVSGHASRLSELRVRAMRVEDVHRIWKNIRTREIEPCLEELNSQYLIASRLHSVRELDWKMSQGQV